MGSLYVLIASIALYALMVRISSSRVINPIFSAIIVVTLPFMLAKAIWYIYLVDNDLPLWQLVSWSDALLVLVQLIVAFVVFYKLQNDDSIETWLLWGAMGLVGIYFIVPYLVRLIVPA